VQYVTFSISFQANLHCICILLIKHYPWYLEKPDIHVGCIYTRWFLSKVQNITLDTILLWFCYVICVCIVVFFPSYYSSANYYVLTP
jgi:hypothetical protein